MVARRILPLLLLFCLLPFQGLSAEGSLTMDMSLTNTVMRTRTSGGAPGDAYYGYSLGGSGGMAFKSRGVRDVKAELRFDFIYPEQTVSVDYDGTGGQDPVSLSLLMLSLDKAYVKVRFPWFRLTVGKTRLGWGDGFVFNSGDVIFGSTGTAVDLTAAEVRSETGWMTALNIPLGRFSFLEGLVMPATGDAEADLLVGDIRESSAGLRFYTKLAGFKWEGGYFFDGDASAGALHKPYLGIQGNLGIDFYLAASAAIPLQSAWESGFRESFNISFGLFHLQQLNRISSLSLRLETLVRPFGRWQPAAGARDYGLLLYPEIAYQVSESLNLSLRSLVSPLDLSAQLTFGADWNVYQGFSLLGYLVANAGESSDLFAWQKAEALWTFGADMMDGAALILGVSFIY